MSRFDDALPLILRLEGGYVDDPDDPGGATNLGVTQTTYDIWRRASGLPARDVKEITQAEASEIYENGFWKGARCDQIAWPASVVLFDAAVNHGIPLAHRMLQEALNVKVDGRVGPVTLAAMEGCDPEATANELLWIRLGHYYRISHDARIKFLRGWIRRLCTVREEVGLA